MCVCVIIYIIYIYIDQLYKSKLHLLGTANMNYMSKTWIPAEFSDI